MIKYCPVKGKANISDGTETKNINNVKYILFQWMAIAKHFVKTCQVKN